MYFRGPTSSRLAINILRKSWKCDLLDILPYVMFTHGHSRACICCLTKAPPLYAQLMTRREYKIYIRGSNTLKTIF